MIITVPKIGIGDEAPLDKPLAECSPSEGPYRPDTTAEWWQVIEDRATEFVIEILDQ